jgi:DNA-binding ferritin-like protein
MSLSRKRLPLATILTGRVPSFNKTRSVNANANNANANANSAGAVYKTIVPTFLHMLNTVKLYHWRTTSYATHKATDDLYGSLNSKLDEFVEVMLGKGEIAGGAKRGNLLTVPNVKLTAFSNNEAFKKQIEYYKKFLLALSNDKTFNVLANTDLLAIRDEILALFNQFLYLLTLSK